MVPKTSETARAASAQRETLLRLVGEECPRVMASLVGPLLELLSLSRRACGGDGDKFLIMLVVAQRTVEHERFATLDAKDLQSGRISVLPSLGTNVSSVADSLGAPKETVRRKVAELVEAGWIARKGNSLGLTTRAYQELGDVLSAMQRTAVRNFETVNGVLGRKGNA